MFLGSEIFSHALKKQASPSHNIQTFKQHSKLLPPSVFSSSYTEQKSAIFYDGSNITTINVLNHGLVLSPATSLPSPPSHQTSTTRKTRHAPRHYAPHQQQQHNIVSSLADSISHDSIDTAFLLRYFIHSFISSSRCQFELVPKPNRASHRICRLTNYQRTWLGHHTATAPIAAVGTRGGSAHRLRLGTYLPARSQSLLTCGESIRIEGGKKRNRNCGGWDSSEGYCATTTRTSRTREQRTRDLSKWICERIPHSPNHQRSASPPHISFKMASSDSTMSTSVVVQRVRTRYHWPPWQLNFWILIMMIGSATILGINAYFLTVQEQLLVGIPWFVPLSFSPYSLFNSARLEQSIGKGYMLTCSQVLPILDNSRLPLDPLPPNHALPNLTTTTPSRHRDNGILHPLRSLDHRVDCIFDRALGSGRREQ